MNYKEFIKLAKTGNMKYKIIDSYNPVLVGEIREVREVKKIEKSLFPGSKEVIFKDGSKIVIREEDMNFLTNGDIRICRLGTYVYTIRII